MTTKLTIQETADLLLEKDNILLLCHKNPDGDTLGSAAALAHVLAAKGKNIAVSCRHRVPVLYD